MSCANPLELVSALLDNRITGEEKENALAHLKTCRTCNASFQATYNLRQSFRSMGQPALPDGLAEKLRVLASHERERRLLHMSLSARWKYWTARIQLSFDNMMRPLALPFVGGLVSALLLLGVWVPTMALKRSVNDVPLPSWVYADPTPREVQTVTAVGEVIVELTIDERGRVVDYTVRSGQMTPEIGSLILFSRFNPATVFGQPTRGKLVYQFNQISVIG